MVFLLREGIEMKLVGTVRQLLPVALNNNKIIITI
jgi:hypothetical protein